MTDAHAIALLPDSARLLHATANVAASDADRPWFQLGLKIELFRSDTPLPGLDVRILRIGTAGHLEEPAVFGLTAARGV